MRGKIKFSVCLMVAIILLASCGKTETIQKLEYDDFKDTITSNDFTGFAYILRNEKEQDNNYLSVIEDVFDRQESQLVFFDSLNAADQTNEKYNKDSSDPELHFPTHRISYFEDGKKISEFELNDQILTDEGNQELEDFIDKYNN